MLTFTGPGSRLPSPHLTEQTYGRVPCNRLTSTKFIQRLEGTNRWGLNKPMTFEEEWKTQRTRTGLCPRK